MRYTGVLVRAAHALRILSQACCTTSCIHNQLRLSCTASCCPASCMHCELLPSLLRSYLSDEFGVFSFDRIDLLREALPGRSDCLHAGHPYRCLQNNNTHEDDRSESRPHQTIPLSTELSLTDVARTSLSYSCKCTRKKAVREKN